MRKSTVDSPEPFIDAGCPRVEFPPSSNEAGGRAPVWMAIHDAQQEFGL